LILFNNSGNFKTIEDRFIQKETVCVYRIIQTV